MYRRYVSDHRYDAQDKYILEIVIYGVYPVSHLMMVKVLAVVFNDGWSETGKNAIQYA